ncbi:carboxymuconolactone decarboxylase family protein [Methylocapsa acidiphila]|uniref:carboxymuconolactone decarboxylase family protein n=1 Tax=Methylocapsa acidiphila TaxID=133552 RepID=UPI00040DDC02|nr:peroxidase-related enzyme [Methylocapsa acidiphila]
MARIAIPDSVDAAPIAARPLLNAVKSQLGLVPNMFRLIATSPESLQGYLGLNGALAKGKLDAATRERIALAVANVNGCAYCNSAHGYLAAHLAKLDAAEIAANRDGRSNDPKADAAVRFASKVTTERGAVAEADLQAVRSAGYSDAEIIEIVVHVALNGLTNYVNNVFATDVDFPMVEARRAA